VALVVLVAVAVAVDVQHHQLMVVQVATAQFLFITRR
jgi:hypothetical protein